MPGPRLEATKVSKTFGVTKVLDSADLGVQPGEIHALVGQKGVRYCPPTSIWC